MCPAKKLNAKFQRRRTEKVRYRMFNKRCKRTCKISMLWKLTINGGQCVHMQNESTQVRHKKPNWIIR